MTVITTLEAQGRIKATNPFPSGEGGDFSLLEIQHKHLILHPNKIKQLFIALLELEYG